MKKGIVKKAQESKDDFLKLYEKHNSNKDELYAIPQSD